MLVFVTGHQLGEFNEFLGPSTKIYLGALPTGIPEVIMQTKQCKNVPHKPCLTQIRESNQTSGVSRTVRSSAAP